MDKLELQTPKTIKLFDNTEKIIDKAKNGENTQSMEVVEVISVEWHFIGNINKCLRYYILLDPVNLILIW